MRRRWYRAVPRRGRSLRTTGRPPTQQTRIPNRLLAAGRARRRRAVVTEGWTALHGRLSRTILVRVVGIEDGAAGHQVDQCAGGQSPHRKFLVRVHARQPIILPPRAAAEPDDTDMIVGLAAGLQDLKLPDCGRLAWRALAELAPVVASFHSPPAPSALRRTPRR